MMLTIYLDNCSIQRPLDTPDHVRIAVEAEAVLGIMGLCEQGRVELASSEMLELEAAKCPMRMRRIHAEAVLGKARKTARVTAHVTRRANELAAKGVPVADALHLSLAESVKADYFCTCDDRLLNKIRRQAGLTIRAVSPVELIEELSK